MVVPVSLFNVKSLRGCRTGGGRFKVTPIRDDCSRWGGAFLSRARDAVFVEFGPVVSLEELDQFGAASRERDVQRAAPVGPPVGDREAHGREGPDQSVTRRDVA